MKNLKPSVCHLEKVRALLEVSPRSSPDQQRALPNLGVVIKWCHIVYMCEPLDSTLRSQGNMVEYNYYSKVRVYLRMSVYTLLFRN